jgi:hypothetical protein
MAEQLDRIVAELRSAQARLHRLTQALPEEAWRRRPAPGRWSVAECVEHLNRTAEAFIPLLHAALELGRRVPAPAPRRLRRDPLGWLLSAIMAAPSVLARTRTTLPFDPSSSPMAEPAELLRRFDERQQELIACVEAGAGLPLDRLRVHSPFDPRIRYSLYSALVLLPRHQARHIAQAERAARRAGPP